MMRPDRENQFAPGKLWSLWDLLRLGLSELLEKYQLLVVERANYENIKRGLTASNAYNQPTKLISGLRDLVSDIEDICTAAELNSTRIAAQRCKQSLDNCLCLHEGRDFVEIGYHDGHNIFHHLMEVCSRLRDDCQGRVYFQIGNGNEKLLDPEIDHFGIAVSKAFPGAIEDISEAASCLALERSTACVFHVMRALEVAAQIVADKIGATVRDANGKGLAWGVIARNMKDKIDKLPSGSDEQIKWFRVQQSLEAVNRAWRVPTAHPKQTYTPDEARKVFEATKAFMQELAPLA